MCVFACVCFWKCCVQKIVSYEKTDGIQKHLLRLGSLSVWSSPCWVKKASSSRITFSICTLHLWTNESHRCVCTHACACAHTNTLTQNPNKFSISRYLETSHRRTNKNRDHVSSWKWFSDGDSESRCCHCSGSQKKPKSNKIWGDRKR